jgi:signal transduction histidine kinase
MWPQGLLARVSWIIVCGGAGLLVLLHAYHVHERLLTSATVFATSVAERLIAIDYLMIQQDMPQARLLAAFSGPEVRIQVADAMPAAAYRDWTHAGEVRGAVQAALADVSHRPFDIRFIAARTGHGGGRPGLIMGLERADGRWLIAQASSDALDTSWASLALSWNLLLIALVLGIMLWLARRALAQLPRFVDAAEQLGRNVTATPLSETSGPREIRRLAAAFNDLQRRITSYLAERTGMLAAVSHDLRTFLTRLALRIELIDDAEQRDRARSDIADMTHLTDGLLAFAREDRAGESVVRLDVATLLDTLLSDTHDMGQNAHYVGPPHCVITGRPLALKRAFANLIDNGVRYGGGIEVNLTEVDRHGIRIDFDDRGPGIPEAERERVLRPFARLEQSRNRDTGGSGLGLAIADTVVRRHGGRLSLNDRDGGGLRVRVDLPRDSLLAQDDAQPRRSAS